MKSDLSRRELLAAAGTSSLLAALPIRSAQQSLTWPPLEGANTPRICLGVRPDIDEKGMRQIKQIGVDSVLMGGPPIPWTEEAVRERLDRFQASALTLCNMMISGFPKTIYGKP